MPSILDLLNASASVYSQNGTLPQGLMPLTGSDGLPVVQSIPEDGFYAAAFVTDAGQVIVAFKGTIPGTDAYGIGSLSADLQIVKSAQPHAYQDALDFIENRVIQAAQACNIDLDNVFVTGHSLGGGEAEFVASRLDLGGAAFGAPGLGQYTNPNPNALSRFTSYVVNGDPIGNFASDTAIGKNLGLSNIDHFGNVKYLGSPSAQNGLLVASSQLPYGNIFGAAGVVAINLPNHYLASYHQNLLSSPPSSPFGQLVNPFTTADSISPGYEQSLSQIPNGSAPRRSGNQTQGDQNYTGNGGSISTTPPDAAVEQQGPAFQAPSTAAPGNSEQNGDQSGSAVPAPAQTADTQAAYNALGTFGNLSDGVSVTYAAPSGNYTLPAELNAGGPASLDNNYNNGGLFQTVPDSSGVTISDASGEFVDSDEPVVLDLTGNGIKITQLSSSSTFFDTTGDGQQNLTAWAGAGNGVLFYDPTSTGQLTQADQIDFTDWDSGATSDMQALEDVFDTNHDGSLGSGDADFADFYVMVTNANGTETAESLASLGITSINLTANTRDIDLPDGSSIDGETTYTTSSGTTGTAATVTFAYDSEGNAVTTTTTTNADGSTTIDNVALNADGSLAYQNILNTLITTSTSNGVPAWMIDACARENLIVLVK